MEQESISNKTVAIIGAGPAGIMCAKILQNSGIYPVLFDKSKPLATILPTGGGRCNLAHAEYDFKELAKNYPHGEKFLYSTFSKFSTAQTLDFFDSIGIETYTQEDNRIFPTSNSAKDVREKMLSAISKCRIIKEKVTDIEKLDNCYKLITDKAQYAFDIVVIAIGGHSNFNMLTNLGLKIIEPVQSLVGLITKEDFSSLAGVSLKNVNCEGLTGDILFTHKGISGPLVYKISSINARKATPFTLSFRLIPEMELQNELNENSKKSIKNLLGQHLPKACAEFILNELNIYQETVCHKINGQTRDKIFDKLTNFEVTITGKVADGEVVTAGGVDLKSIKPTLETKDFGGLYVIGEALDIDGFCGGFNLQNCWSTGFVAAQSIAKTYFFK